MKDIKITDNEAGQRLDRFLRKLLKDESLKDIYKYMRKGIVKVNGKKAKENYRIQVDDIITLYNIDIDTKKGYRESFKEINIVYEDDNLIIVDKPSGLLSHPESPDDNDTLIQRVMGHILKSGLENYSPTFSPALCNRLDRNTSGLIIAAKNYNALKNINETIRDRGLIKHYTCIVKGIPKDKGEIKSIVRKDRKKRIGIFETTGEWDGKEARTKYEKLRDNGEFSLLNIELITGKFHQIRVHLSSIGHPIIGDAKYGDKDINYFFNKNFGLNHQFLIAHSLYFENPHSSLEYLKGKHWNSRIPENFNIIIKALFGDIKV